jgi:tetratricopeptide (TPR) repeat protein
MYRFLLIITSVLLFIDVYSQNNEIDSLKKVLRATISDTAKLSALKTLVEVLPEGQWQKYNVEMKESAEKMLQNNSLNKIVKRTVLKYYAMAIHNDAVNLIDKNKNTTAIPLLEKCTKIFIEIGDSSEAGWAYNDMASAYFNNDEMKKTIDCYYKGLCFFEKVEDSEGITDVYIGLGLIQYKQKDYKKAIDLYTKAHTFASKIEYNNGMYQALYRIAYCYQTLENYDSALAYFQKSTLVLDSLTKSAEEEVVSNNIAYAYIAKRDFKKAINQLHISLEINKRKNDTVRMISTNELISETYADLGNYDKATQYGERALELLRKSLNYNYDIVKVARNLYHNYKAKKDYKNALKMFELYQEKSQDIQNKEVGKNLLQKELEFSFEKKELLLKTENEKLISKMKFDKERENDRRYNLIIIFGSLFVVLFISFYSVYKFQRQKAVIASQNSDLFRQKMLLSQMNPHFIFNSINSIQNYVLNKNEDAAYNYLAKFSKLIRMVLNNSREDNITLDIEIETLALYVELEQLRFDNKFSYELKVSEHLNTFDIKIPAMLIQPYVENAILHGLMNLNEERNGKLVIEIKTENNMLKVIVEDNGIGRERSKQFKKESIHDPIAMKLTEERVEIINKLENAKNVKILITDLYDAQQKASGTRVELFLPLTS